jgi:hypothetical protein
METELVFEILLFNLTLKRLIAQENFIASLAVIGCAICSQKLPTARLLHYYFQAYCRGYVDCPLLIVFKLYIHFVCNFLTYKTTLSNLKHIKINKINEKISQSSPTNVKDNGLCRHYVDPYKEALKNADCKSDTSNKCTPLVTDNNMVYFDWRVTITSIM